METTEFEVTMRCNCPLPSHHKAVSIIKHIFGPIFDARFLVDERPNSLVVFGYTIHTPKPADDKVIGDAKLDLVQQLMPRLWHAEGDAYHDVELLVRVVTKSAATAVRPDMTYLDWLEKWDGVAKAKLLELLSRSDALLKWVYDLPMSLIKDIIYVECNMSEPPTDDLRKVIDDIKEDIV